MLNDLEHLIQELATEICSVFHDDDREQALKVLFQSVLHQRKSDEFQKPDMSELLSRYRHKNLMTMQSPLHLFQQRLSTQLTSHVHQHPIVVVKTLLFNRQDSLVMKRLPVLSVQTQPIGLLLLQAPIEVIYPKILVIHLLGILSHHHHPLYVIEHGHVENLLHVQSSLHLLQ
jgi:hypothetical protein